MILFKNFIQITVYLFFAFTLNIIQWSPSLVVENIVNIAIVILYIVSILFVYKTIRAIADLQEKRVLWRLVVYAAFLLSYIGLSAIFMIGMGYDKSSFVRKYKFNDKEFYVYKNSDLSYEVSIRDGAIPIRSLPIVTFNKDLIVLKKENDFVYALSNEEDTKIYNLKTNKKVNDE